MTNLSRRRVLAMAGTGIGAALAGCSGGQATNGSGQGTTTTMATRATGTKASESEHGTNPYIPTPVGDPADQQTVSMAMTVNGGHYFIPTIVWVTKGGTVTFVNSTGGHTATAYSSKNGKSDRIPDGATSFDSGLLHEPGATFKHTFDTPGIYDYYCKPHEPLGMVGKIIVGGPKDVDQEPAMGPPTSLPKDGKTFMQDLRKRTK